MTPRYAPPVTTPYRYPTNGSPPPTFNPVCARDLWLPSSWARLTAWEAKHWSFIRDCSDRGAAAKRGTIPTEIFTQLDLMPAARGVVWDIRGGRPLPLNFDLPTGSHLHTSFLAEALRSHPDQELVSFATQGVATKTDAGSFVMAFGPHLTSLPPGMSEVIETVTDLVDKGWYGRFRTADVPVPYTPMYSIPQGSTLKSDDTQRRTSDFGVPRKQPKVPFVSLNDMARKAGGVPEVKPNLSQQANDVAVLKYAADLWGEDLYCLSDDVKSFFNQFRLHPSELHKSCFLWLDKAAGEDPVPAWISEYVLGFGHSASSGIAQRFAHAVLWLLRRRFDAEEAPLLAAETDPARRAYLDERAALGPNQATLWSADIFTDDAAMYVVGAARVARLLAAWGQLLDDIGLIMAGPKKRMIGTTIKWLGVYLNTFLANQIIPEDKALKASTVLQDLLSGRPVEMRLYRSLMGRLEHLRNVLEGERSLSYHMYTPFAGGTPHPRARVWATPEILERGEEWRSLLLHRPGRTCARFAPSSFSAAPADAHAEGRVFFVYTDAALLGAPVPGLGGFLAGRFFSYALPPDMLGYGIPQLEFLAIIAAAIAYRNTLAGATAVLVTDSITSFHVIHNNGARSAEMQWLHLELKRVIGRVPIFAETRHGYGETNPAADLASRGRLAELRELCEQVGVQPIEIDLPEEFHAILRRFRARFGAKFAKAGAQAAYLARNGVPAGNSALRPSSSAPTPEAAPEPRQAVAATAQSAPKTKRRSPAAGVRFGEAKKPGPMYPLGLAGLAPECPVRGLVAPSTPPRPRGEPPRYGLSSLAGWRAAPPTAAPPSPPSGATHPPPTGQGLALLARGRPAGAAAAPSAPALAATAAPPPTARGRAADAPTRPWSAAAALTPTATATHAGTTSHPRLRLDALSLGWAGPAIAGPASAPPLSTGSPPRLPGLGLAQSATGSATRHLDMPTSSALPYPRGAAWARESTRASSARRQQHASIIAKLAKPHYLKTAAATRAFNTANMGFFEADQSPFGFDSEAPSPVCPGACRRPLP